MEFHIPPPNPQVPSPFRAPGSKASTCEWIVETNNLIHLFFCPEREGGKEGLAGACVHCLHGAGSPPAHHLPGLGRAVERGRVGRRWGKSRSGTVVLLGGASSPAGLQEASRGQKRDSSLATLRAALVILIHHSCLLLGTYYVLGIPLNASNPVKYVLLSPLQR